jgi:hypothetical protein
MSKHASELFPFQEFNIDEKLCFVIMPFDEKYNSVYEHIIKPVVKVLGLEAKRGDDLLDVKEIIQDIWSYINKAKLIIADLSSKNPNVFYEVGLSHAIGKKVILITNNIEDVPFDLRHLRCITYHDSIGGGEKLKNSLIQNIKQVMKE